MCEQCDEAWERADRLRDLRDEMLIEQARLERSDREA